MPKINVIKGEDGKLHGLGQTDERHFRRFVKKTAEMQVGESMGFTFQFARSPEFHGRHFAILNRIFESQATFSNDYNFRKWAEIGAGHVEWIPGPDGAMQAIPKSIDYLSLDDDEFREVHRSVMEFLRTPHALRILWPHQPDLMVSWQGVDNLIEAGR